MRRRVRRHGGGRGGYPGSARVGLAWMESCEHRPRVALRHGVGCYGGGLAITSERDRSRSCGCGRAVGREVAGRLCAFNHIYFVRCIVHFIVHFLSSDDRTGRGYRRLGMVAATIDITEARKEFNRLDERVGEERVIHVTRHGKPVFAVVDIEYLQAVLETIEIVSDPDSFRMFQEGLEDIRAGRVHSHEDVKRELGL